MKKNYGSNKKYLVNIRTNEFIFYNSKENFTQNKGLVGFCTDGIVTCSAISISINYDEFAFFAIIHEKLDLCSKVEKLTIPLLKNEKIIDIDIVYSLGVDSFRESRKRKTNFRCNIYD